MRCRHCFHRALLDGETLAAKFKRPRLLSSVWFRCTRCGSREVDLEKFWSKSRAAVHARLKAVPTSSDWRSVSIVANRLSLQCSSCICAEMIARSSRCLGGENVTMRKLALVALLGLTGCAPTPESIQPSYVSEVPYESWSCLQLGEESSRLDNALSTASVQQNTARSNDVAGVIFLGLPVGSMSGQSIAPTIARYKGEKEAVNRAMIKNSCGEMMRLHPPAAPAPAPAASQPSASTPPTPPTPPGPATPPAKPS